MSSECKKKEYFDAANSQGKNLAAESLFLILILEQQKKINQLIAKLQAILWNLWRFRSEPAFLRPTSMPLISLGSYQSFD